MKTILLCGYRLKDENENHGALIDARIEELQALKYDVVCVLGGGEADQILRSSKLLANVEICFDTSENPTLMTNARAGACATTGEAVFILPIDIAAPAKSVWDFLKNEHGKIGFATEHGFLQTEEAPYHFPLLITVKGSKRLEKMADTADFTDALFKPVVFTAA